MNHVSRTIFLTLVLVISGTTIASAGEGGYFPDMVQAWKRAGKNLVGFPLEIPYTMRRYYQTHDHLAQWTLAGFVDGTFRSVSRLTTGVWDITASVIPGAQDGVPMEPVTLF